MKKRSYEITINAPKQKVWDVLWADESYRKWTSAFSDVSYAESDWEEGSRITFLNGTNCGMYSVIEKKDAPKTMVFKHLGEIADGVEKPFAPETGWTNSLEGYYLTEENGVTKVVAEMDMDESHQDFFDKTFPAALGILKELSEA